MDIKPSQNDSMVKEFYENWYFELQNLQNGEISNLWQCSSVIGLSLSEFLHQMDPEWCSVGFNKSCKGEVWFRWIYRWAKNPFLPSFPFFEISFSQTTFLLINFTHTSSSYTCSHASWANWQLWLSLCPTQIWPHALVVSLVFLPFWGKQNSEKLIFPLNQDNEISLCQLSPDNQSCACFLILTWLTTLSHVTILLLFVPQL